MISISRATVRSLCSVFRRLLPSRHATPAAVCLRIENSQLMARLHCGNGAAEFTQPHSGPNASAMVPLEMLEASAGKDESLVSITMSAENAVELRWTQNGVPQVRTCETPETKGAFPAAPASWTSNPPGLLIALVEAAAVTAQDSTRYALDHVQLHGGTGEVVGTDSRQLLIQGGFQFPWPGSMLIGQSSLAVVKALPSDEVAQIGATDGWVWLRSGSWTLAFPINTESRYPDVHAILPSRKVDTTRLVLDPSDAELLTAVLPDLSGSDDPQKPVTLDLTDTVKLRARAEGQTQATELALARSTVSGPAMRLVMNRSHLSRARKLGFLSLDCVAPSRPVVCRQDRRIFVAMPLEENLAVPPTENMLRVGQDQAVKAVERKRSIKVVPRPIPVRSAARQTEAPSPKSGLLDELASVQSDLRGVLGRVHRLASLVRQERRKHKLLKATLDSLHKLQRVGA